MALLEFKSDVWDAANTGNLHALVTALASHPHLIDTPHPHKLGEKTPMYIAAEKGHVEIITKLVELGSHAIDTPARDGCTPMFAATWNGHVLAIETLVRLGSKAIDTPNNDGWTPMFAAALNGHVSAIETLVRLGSTAIDTPDNDGWTPVCWAARRGYTGCLKTLKLLGADCSTDGISDREMISDEMVELLNARVDEDEAWEVRYRVYFRQSLVDRLLLEVDVQHHRRMSEVGSRS